MDHDGQDYDPLSPPPSHTEQQQQQPDHGGLEYTHDQTVPNLESGGGGGNPYEPNYSDQFYRGDADPKNFHTVNNADLDLPANFAKEAVGAAAAAKHREEYNSDEDDEDFHGQNQEDRDYIHNENHGQFQQSSPFGAEGDEALYYQQQQEQQHQQQQHQMHHGEYMDSGGDGGSSLENSMNNSNPFAQSDSSYLASSAGSGAANSQRGYDQDFGGVEDDRPIMGGGYPRGYGVEGERSPMSDDSQHQQHPLHQQDLQQRSDEVYDDNEDDDEDEGLARDDIEERRLCESGSSLPEQEGSYGASPPEADRFREQQNNADDDVAEGQRLESHDDENAGHGQGQGQDEMDADMKSMNMEMCYADPAMMPDGYYDDESDSEKQPENFGYNKMEEEETAEDVSGDEETEVGGGGQQQNVQPAGFDNHAFDDNDDEDAEVMQRKVEDTRKDDEVDSHMQQGREEFPQQQTQESIPEKESKEEIDERICGPSDPLSDDSASNHSEENIDPQIRSEGVDRSADFVGMGSSVTEDQQQGVHVSEQNIDSGFNPEDKRFEDKLPYRSDNYMGIDCSGHNFGRGYSGGDCEEEQDEFEQSGGSDVLIKDEYEDRQVEYKEENTREEEEEDEDRKMEREEEFIVKETTTSVESAVVDSNIDMGRKEEIDMDAGFSGVAVTHQQQSAQSEEEDDSYHREEEDMLEENKENYTPQQTFGDDQRQEREQYDYQQEVDEREQKQEVLSNVDSHIATTSAFNQGFEIGEAEKQQEQQQQQQTQDEYSDQIMYGGEREKEGEEEEEVGVEVEQQGHNIQAEHDQLFESTDQSAVEISNTPSSIGGDFQPVTSLKDGAAVDGAAKPPRSFVDMIEDMASPETIPQPLPSPPKPDSMAHEFDPLAPADNSDDDDDRDQDDFIMEKQHQQQQFVVDPHQQQLYQQHETDQQQNTQLIDGGGGLYETNHVNNDTREESSEELCLRAGEIEGETKFGVDGSAITTSTDRDVIGAADEGQQPKQRGFVDDEDDDDDDEEDDIVNAGVATDYTTTTTTTETTETEERSGADFDSTSLGQAGFEQGFETGGGADTDNALMSMSMEGSFYDDGGELMGGADGVNGGNEGSNLLIQSAITEVSEPTSSFSPHVDSVLRSEQHVFEEKLSEQNHAEEEDNSTGFDDRQMTPERPMAVEEEEVKVQTTHESFAAIPSGFEDQPAEQVVSPAINDFDFGQQNVTTRQGHFDDEKEDVDVSSHPFNENNRTAAAVHNAGEFDSFMDAPRNENVSSSVDDPFGLQSNDLVVGSGGVVSGGEFEGGDSSSVDNNAALSGGFMEDTNVNSRVSALNGYHYEDDNSASLVSNEISDNFVPDGVNEVTNSSAAFDGQELDQGTVTLTDEAVDKTGGNGATDDISVSSAAEVSDISSSQPAVSSSVDAGVAPVPVIADATEKKDEKKKKPEDDKEKKKTGVSKDKKETTTKTSTAKRPTSATTKTSTTTTAKKTTTTSSSSSTTTTKKTTVTAPPVKSKLTTKSATRPTSATSSPASSSAAKKPETPKSSTTSATTRKPASASAADKKATSPTKPAASTPGSAKPLPRYAQPVTPRKPRDASTGPASDSTTAKKTPTPRPATAPTTPRTRPTSATTKSTTSTTSRLTSTTTSTTPSPRPKTSPTKLSNGSTPTTEKRSTSPTKKYTAPSRTPTSTTAKATTEKKEVKASPRTPLAARSPTKLASPRTPSNSASPRTGAAATNGKASTPRKPDYSNVTSRIGSKDKITHKPGGGNVKIESRKVKVEAKSKIGSLDNASHKPQGGDKKIETKKLDWKVESKIGSLDNASHVAGGGDKKIETQKTDWNAKSRIGSLEKANHKPGGGDKKIETVKTEWNAESKIGSLNNVKHKPGGGEKQIESHHLDFKEKASPKIGSLTPKRLNSSGSEQSEPVQLVVENGADGGSPV